MLFFTQHDLAHLPVSESTSSYHLPHTPSKSFYLVPQQQLYFCKLTPSHLYLYAPHVQTTSISPGALCQTPSLFLTFLEVPHLTFCLSVSLHTSILSSFSRPNQ